MLDVRLKKLDSGLPTPSRARRDDAGVDLYAREAVSLPPGARALVGTGIAIAVPSGYGAFVHPRSGLALRHGLSIVNTPGTIDAGYRGEIKVLLINHDLTETIHIDRADRIAQLVIQPVAQVEFTQVDELDDTDRGEGGYGSSGGHRSIGTGTTHEEIES